MRAAMTGLMVLMCLLVSTTLSAEEKAKTPADNTPPEGFTALFNGKDLTGWKGLMKDPLDSPAKRAQATPEQLAAAQKEADETMKAHWAVKEGVLEFDGKGRSLATAKDYADFEMFVDWKIKEAGDSGVYVRGCPQIQIWDPSVKAAGGVGSGGLYNNQKNPSTPSKKADNQRSDDDRSKVVQTAAREPAFGPQRAEIDRRHERECSPDKGEHDRATDDDRGNRSSQEDAPNEAFSSMPARISNEIANLNRS